MAKTPIILLAGQAGSGKDTVGNYIAQKYNGVCVGQADPLKRFVKNVFGFSEESLWGPSELRNAEQPLTKDAKELFWDYAKEWLVEVLPPSIEPGSDYDKGSPYHRLAVWMNSFSFEKRTLISPRFALQTLGTQWGRSVSQNMWSDYAIRTCRSLLGRGYTYSRVDGLVTTKDAGYDYAVITDARFSNEVVNVSCVNGAVFKISRPGTAAPTSGIAGHQSEKELGDIPRHFFDICIKNTGTFDELFAAVDHSMDYFYDDDRARLPLPRPINRLGY